MILAGALLSVKTTHHPALPPKRIPELLERLSNYKGRLITRLAVELTLLTFIRSSEMRFARWNEIDFDRSEWTIPANPYPV